MEDMRDMLHSADMLKLMNMLGRVDMTDLVAMMDMQDKVIRLKLWFTHKNTESRQVCVFFPYAYGFW